MKTTKELNIDNYLIKAGALFKVTSLSSTKINTSTNPGDLTDIQISNAATALAVGLFNSSGFYVCPHAHYIYIDPDFSALWVSGVRIPAPPLHYVQNIIFSLTKQALVVDEEALKDAILGHDLAIPVLTLGSVTSTSFVVTWGAVTNASGYKVSIDGGTTYGTTQTGTSFTKSDATATTEYGVKVIAVAGTGSIYRDSYESTELEVITRTPLASPVLTQGAVTATSFALSWLAITNASGYQVSIDNGVTYGATQTELSFSKEDATASTTYLVKVKAIATGSVYENSPASTALSIETLAE